jgi:DNA-binding SARP family transcriptional activator
MSHDGIEPGSTTVMLSGEVGCRRPDGSIEVLRGSQPQLVLCYLLIERRTVERYELAELLWGDRMAEHWAGAIRGVLSKIRAWLRAAELPGAIVADSGLVRLDLAAAITTNLDLATVELDTAQHALDIGDTGAARDAAARAAVLLQGPFLPHGDGDWVTRQRDRFEAMAATAARVEARALLAGGNAARAVEVSADRVRRDPLDERAHHLLIEALLACGRRADAMRAYADLTSVLATELGISPSPETAAMVTRVSAAEPTAPATPASPGARRRPPGPSTSSARRPDEPIPPATPPTGARRSARAESDVAVPFVGRRREMDELLAAWTSTQQRGQPSLITIRGDAGIGKTCLAEEFGERMAADGTQVLWGRCRATSGLAFEPVVELLDEAIHADPGVLARLGATAGHLAPLLPDLRLPPTAVPLDAALERNRIFGAVSAVMAEVSARPAVWVIDDLQWASPDTTALLEVVLERVPAPLFVVATYRGRAAAVEAMLARLQRTTSLRSVDLAGLEVEEVRDVVRPFHPGAGAIDEALVLELHHRTGGNAFFLAEIAREARRTGTGLDARHIPDTARQWIERRADALDPSVSAVLDLSAVLGMDVDLGLLDACSTLDDETFARACEVLIEQGLLIETDDPDSLSFPHLISRDAIYERLRSPRRLQLHRRVAQTLDAQPMRAGRDRALAHHLARLGPEAADRAAIHALAAGQDALGQAAWAVAEEQFTLAAALGGSPHVRAQALIGLGRSHYRRADLPAARRVLDEAIDLARANDLPIDLAEAALQLVGRAGRGAAIDMTDEAREALLREAIARLEAMPADALAEDDAAEPNALLGELEGELALALLFADAAEEREALVTRSFERASAAEPRVPRHLARALLGTRIAKLHPHQLAERLADDDAVLAMGDDLPAEQVIAALAYQHEDRLLTGDRAGARVSLAELTAAVDAHPHPYWSWVARTWTTLSLIIDGDLDAAEAAAFDAAAQQPGDQGESTACLGVNLISIRLWQGRSGEVIDLVAAAADQFPQVPCYRAVHALCAAKAGDQTQAQTAYRRFADVDFHGIPFDTNRFLALAVLADVAVDLGDTRGARTLVELLTPYRGLQVVLNCYGGGGAYWGPASLQLARLARLTGRRDEADGLFAEAIGQTDAFDAPAARTAAARASLRSANGATRRAASA